MAPDESSSSDTETGLIQWVNSFSLSQRVESLNELNNGRALWEMLREIRDEHFHEELPSKTQSNYAREQNLKFLHWHISAYLNGEGVQFQSLTENDLKDLAANGSNTTAIHLLKLVLLSAIYPVNAQIIEKIQTLPHPAPHVLKVFIQEIAPSEEGDFSDRESELGSQRRSDPSTPSRKLDRELALEERIANLTLLIDRKDADLRDQKSQQEDIGDAYLRLQEEHKATAAQLSDCEQQLKKLHSVHYEREHSSLRDLEITVSQQEETISHHESQIVQYQSKEAELERKVNRLDKIEKEKQDLQDLFDEQKVKLEEQTRKANSGENYKRKLQASQGLERERDGLRQQLEESRSRLQDYDSIRRTSAKLGQENHEMSQTLSRSERDNTELRETKQSYLAEISRLRKALDDYREVFASGQERVMDLEGASAHSDTHSSLNMANGDLELELAETSKIEEQSKIRLLEIEKQLGEVTNDANEKENQITTLKRQLAFAQKLSAEQDQKIQGNRQEISLLQSSLAEARQGHSLEGMETLNEAQEQLIKEQLSRVELGKQLSATNKEFSIANNDKEKQWPGETMRSQDNFDALRSLHDNLQREYYELKSKTDKPSFQELEEIIHRAIEDETDERQENENTDFRRRVEDRKKRQRESDEQGAADWRAGCFNRGLKGTSRESGSAKIDRDNTQN